MHKCPKLFESMTAMVLVMATVATANAADPARGASTVRGRTAASASQRMPTLPAFPIFSGGNVSTSTPSIPDTSDPGVTDPGVSDPDPQPIPSNCADGGVETSDYTVDNCMNDVLMCVNSGALPGGLNDLFNEDLRNSIMNGMGLCLSQVERCVTDVRKNCAPVYNAASDVWIDFNSRKIQPEYYNFVLRKTGLTPNQAENTCYLLDKNTFGPSFAAVDNGGRVTAEYDNQVGAYNGQQGNILIKNNPQGLTPNAGDDDVDGGRGHYARWDATTATCLLRVAAYNKDKQITNTWLFGAAGDDKPAEVWRAAGESFSCNKDLFGFSLMNKTRTAAVVGIGGGAVLGGAIGAAAGGKDKHRGVVTETTEAVEVPILSIPAKWQNESEEAYAARVEKIQAENEKTREVWKAISDNKTTSQQAESTGMSRGAAAGIGAGVGAGTGGVAAAITAFIEKNNINCRVGDGLDHVGYGKSYNIGTLKDFYVKWNLQLPDTVAPTAQVTDCASWQSACARYTDLNQCAVAQVNYKPAGAVGVTLVPTACQVSGSTCVVNTTVARSQGACQ